MHVLGGQGLVVPGPRVADSAEHGRGAARALRPMKIIASWSSGKDSAWMLHVLRQQYGDQVRDS